jgi:photosystem II stability/assembly factor-like uncharacterized protein
MTLQTLFHASRKVAIAGILVTSSILSTATGLLAQKTEKQEIEQGERNYGPEIHEIRQRMITEPATSGDIKDYTQVRLFGYEAWKSIGNSHAFKALAAPAWNQVSTTGSQSGHTSGRARSIAFHPTDPNTVWIATAQGGIWRTNEIYAESPKWVNLSENLPTLAMGAIAVDPKDPNIIFAGTGENNGGYSTPSGLGLYRSVNGGLDWQLVLAADSGGTTKTEAGNSCAQVVIDPKDSKTIYVATANGSGLVRSKDGGNSWKKVTTETISPVSIALNPQETNRIYISGMNGKVYRSENGGDTWTLCTLGTLTSSGRIQLALWNANPNVVYAAVLKPTNGGTTQIYRTENHGETWTLQCDANAMVNGYPDRNSKKVNYLWNNIQGGYAHSLAVDPVNGNIVAGGLFIVFSSASDKAQNLNSRTQNGTPNVSDYVHADCQFLAFNTDGKLFALSDGGISYASANGTNWSSKANQNIGSLQFVGVDADRAFTYVVGGTQDNGTNKAAPGTDVNWKEVRGGDGGMTRVSQEDPSIVFGTSVGGDRNSVILRSNDFGNSWSDNIECNPELSMEFYPKYDISANANVVAVAGGNTVFVDPEGGLSCFPVKGKVVGGSSTTMSSRPSAIHIAPYNEFMMWAGVNENIFYTLDQGENWTKVSVSQFSGFVSDITSDLSNPQLVYAVSAGASPTPGQSFARSSDGGKTWEWPAKALPSIPTWSVAKAKNGNLFIGTDFGVLFSTDNGVTWSKLGEGLPMSQILSLDVRGADEQWLLAGTFGRGAYYIDIRNPAGGVSPEWKRTISVGKSYPNPVTAATSEVKVDFSLENAGLAQVVLHDIQGRDVMTLAKDQYTAGSHSFTIPVADLEAGTYFYSLTSDGQTISDKLVVTK